MQDKIEQELESTLASLEALEDYTEELVNDRVSLESFGEKVDYLQVRRLQELELSLGMEGLDMNDVRDVFAAAGRASIATGRGFMKMVDTVHRWVDQTHLVRLQQTRTKIKSLPEADAKINKGRMERNKLAVALSVGGEFPTNFDAYAEGLVDFSRRTGNTVLPDLASMSRAIGARLEAKRWMGNDAFNAEVLEITKIIGQYKLPMQRYPDTDYRRLFPGNRSIFSTIKPRRPRREPKEQSGAVRKVIDGLTSTTVGVAKRSDYTRGKADSILPILNGEQMLEMLTAAEQLLREAVRIGQLAKGYSKDRLPSTFSMMISGFYHGVKRQFDDVWTAQDDGFDVIETRGGQSQRHKPGKRNPLGGATGGLVRGGIGMEKDQRDEDEQRSQMAVWVTRYLKLSLLDHQRTAQSLILLLLGVAKTYMEYVDESLDYYT